MINTSIMCANLLQALVHAHCFAAREDFENLQPLLDSIYRLVRELDVPIMPNLLDKIPIYLSNNDWASTLESIIDMLLIFCAIYSEKLRHQGGF
jgi:hypothetical protein